MESSLGLIFVPDFACVLSLLEPVDFSGLRLVSVPIYAQTSVLRQNQRYWKQRFERAIKYTLPVDQDPGITSWLWKYQQTLEVDETVVCHPLFFSPEIWDVKLVCELRAYPKDFEDKCELFHCIIDDADNVANYAEVIRLLASIPELEMEACLSTEYRIVDIASSSRRVIEALLDPTLGMTLDICRIIEQLGIGDTDTELFLLNHPSANIAKRFDDYFEVAIDGCRPVTLKFLLDRDDVEVSGGVIKQCHRAIQQRNYYAGAKATIDVLMSHPKTRDVI